MALILCPECGAEISDKSTSCIKCGYPLSNEKPIQKENTLKCPECGNDITSETKFCGKCGFEINANKESINQPKIHKYESVLYEEIAGDIAYGKSEKYISKKLQARGITDLKSIELIHETKKNTSSRRILVRKFRNQFIIGVIILIIGFLISSEASNEGKQVPSVVYFGILFGFLFFIRGAFGWIKYRIQNR